MTPEIRPASTADLEQIYDVWLDAEMASAGQPGTAPPRRVPPSLHQHELETGRMLVAEMDGRIAGFTALITRRPVHFLAELYVQPDQQSKGIGRKLLEAVLPDEDRATVCTLSSDDERALSLYIGHGMQPQWPFFYLRADASDLGGCPAPDIDVVEAQPGDPNLMNWDRGICGRERPEDHAHWAKDVDGLALWFKREGHTAGYGYLQMRSEESLWYPDALTIGPIGSRTIEDARLCVLAAVALARDRAAVTRIAIPGPHPAGAPLLEAGFRITDMDIFVCRGSGMFADPRRYVPSGGALF
jgi:GNAT superfamily N-acetyltransferase